MKKKFYLISPAAQWYSGGYDSAAEAKLAVSSYRLDGHVVLIAEVVEEGRLVTARVWQPIGDQS
jgi:hypothetical protein